MSTICRFLIALVLSVSAASAQTRIYRDPAGRYSVPVPAAWTATPAGPMLTLSSGETYALIAVVEGGAAEPRRVAQFTDQFGRQWQGYQRLQNGSATLAGIRGAVVLYSGRNPKGVDAMVKAISIPRGDDAYLLVFSGPVPDWESKKAAMESIERGFSLGTPNQPAPNQPAPNQPAPRTAAPQATYPAPYTPSPYTPSAQAMPPTAQGRRELPAGFAISARSGATGQALTASFDGGESARMVFRGVFKHLGSYFDSPPQLQGALADPQDQQIQGFFRSVYQGVPVRGLMSLTVNGGKGYTSVLFDREDLFARSLSTLSKGMVASLPKGAPGGGGATGGGPARVLPLQQTPLLDNSGYVGLPAGWRITGSFKGVVDIVGPNEQGVSLGGYQVAYSNPLPGTPASTMVGPYLPPVRALGLYLDTLTQHALRSGRASMRIIEQQPVPSQTGQSAYMLYEASMQGKTTRGLALVTTAPVDNTSWFFYMSVVMAPAEHFNQDFPTMWAMWKSWSVNPAVFRERMDAALQSMRETYKIIQSVHDNTQRTYDNVNTAWSQVIRGVTTIEDIVSKERADVDTNNVDYLLRRLNENGYQYKQVPLPELTR